MRPSVGNTTSLQLTQGTGLSVFSLSRQVLNEHELRMPVGDFGRKVENPTPGRSRIGIPA
jgi:hypothetical protein